MATGSNYQNPFSEIDYLFFYPLNHLLKIFIPNQCQNSGNVEYCIGNVLSKKKLNRNLHQKGQFITPLRINQ